MHSCYKLIKLCTYGYNPAFWWRLPCLNEKYTQCASTLDPGYKYHQWLCTSVQVCGWKMFGCHASCQQVSRCRTGGETEESIASTQWSMKMRDPLRFETQDRCPKHAYQWPVKEHVSTTEIKKNPSVLFIPFAQISFRQSSPLNWITLSPPELLFSPSLSIPTDHIPLSKPSSGTFSRFRLGCQCEWRLN